MIKIGEEKGRITIQGTPVEIIAEISTVVESFYSSVPEEFKPPIKKMILDCMSKALGDDSGNKEKTKKEEEGKLLLSEDELIRAGGEAFNNMLKNNPGIFVMMDVFLEFYAYAVKIAFKKDKEEKK